MSDQRQPMIAKATADELYDALEAVVDAAHAVDPDAALEPSIYRACVVLKNYEREAAGGSG